MNKDKLNWNNIKFFINSLNDTSFNPPIVLDSSSLGNNENLIVYRMYTSLVVDSNIGRIYLPDYIVDEDDIFTIEDILIDLLPRH